MIQRIQSLFLMAVVILSGLMFTGNLMVMDNGEGTLFSLRFAGLYDGGTAPAQQLWPLTLIIVLVPVMALVAVLLFKNRRLQMRFIMLVLLLSLGTFILGAFYIYMFTRKFDVTLVWKVRAVFPVVSAILAWLAYRAVMKDDMKVRSYDRLR